jgi:hypothetical protein
MAYSAGSTVDTSCKAVAQDPDVSGTRQIAAVHFNVGLQFLVVSSWSLAHPYRAEARLTKRKEFENDYRHREVVQ